MSRNADLRTDLIGKVFGKLTVVAFHEMRTGGGYRRGAAFWRCKCACGTKNVIARRLYLTSGRQDHCGCLSSERNSAAQLARPPRKRKKQADLTGRRFGLLTVKRFYKFVVYSSGSSAPVWVCKCDCGTTKLVIRYHLIKGKTLTCGKGPCRTKLGLWKRAA